MTSLWPTIMIVLDESLTNLTSKSLEVVAGYALSLYK